MEFSTGVCNVWQLTRAMSCWEVRTFSKNPEPESTFFWSFTLFPNILACFTQENPTRVKHCNDEWEKRCSEYPYCYVVRPSKVYHILLDHFRLNRTQLVCCDVLYFNEIAALGSIRNFQWQLRNFKCRTPQSCSFGTLGNDVIVVDNNQGRRQRDASHCVQPKLGSEATGMPK